MASTLLLRARFFCNHSDQYGGNHKSHISDNDTGANNTRNNGDCSTTTTDNITSNTSGCSSSDHECWHHLIKGGSKEKEHCDYYRWFRTEEGKKLSFILDPGCVYERPLKANNCSLAVNNSNNQGTNTTNKLEDSLYKVHHPGEIIIECLQIEEANIQHFSDHLNGNSASTNNIDSSRRVLTNNGRIPFIFGGLEIRSNAKHVELYTCAANNENVEEKERYVLTSRGMQYKNNTLLAPASTTASTASTASTAVVSKIKNHPDDSVVAVGSTIATSAANGTSMTLHNTTLNTSIREEKEGDFDNVQVDNVGDNYSDVHKSSADRPNHDVSTKINKTVEVGEPTLYSCIILQPGGPTRVSQVKLKLKSLHYSTPSPSSFTTATITKDRDGGCVDNKINDDEEKVIMATVSLIKLKGRLLPEEPASSPAGRSGTIMPPSLPSLAMLMAGQQDSVTPSLQNGNSATPMFPLQHNQHHHNLPQSSPSYTSSSFPFASISNNNDNNSNSMMGSIITAMTLLAKTMEQSIVSNIKSSIEKDVTNLLESKLTNIEKQLQILQCTVQSQQYMIMQQSNLLLDQRRIMEEQHHTIMNNASTVMKEENASRQASGAQNSVELSRGTADVNSSSISKNDQDRMPEECAKACEVRRIGENSEIVGGRRDSVRDSENCDTTTTIDSSTIDCTAILDENNELLSKTKNYGQSDEQNTFSAIASVKVNDSIVEHTVGPAHEKEASSDQLNKFKEAIILATERISPEKKAMATSLLTNDLSATSHIDDTIELGTEKSSMNENKKAAISLDSGKNKKEYCLDGAHDANELEKQRLVEKLVSTVLSAESTTDTLGEDGGHNDLMQFD